MIVLENNSIEPKSCNIQRLTSSDSRTISEDDIKTSAFMGHQIFIVNGVDLSHYMPLLFFAQQLYHCASKLKAGASECHMWDLDSVWKMQLKRHGLTVYIERISEYEPDGPKAEVDLDELLCQSKQYLHKLYYQCCLLCPPLQLEPAVLKWLGLAAD